MSSLELSQLSPIVSSGSKKKWLYISTCIAWISPLVSVD